MIIAGQADGYTAWRITRDRYVSLDGEGARKLGGRWNSPGLPVVYLSCDAALTVLEVIVHFDLPPELLPDDYVLMAVQLGGFRDMAQSDWLEFAPDTSLKDSDSRAFGDRWLSETRTPCLVVPSVIVPESKNLLLNPQHPLFDPNVVEVSRRPFTFDDRLIS